MNRSKGNSLKQHEVVDLTKLHIAVIRDVAALVNTPLEHDIKTLEHRVCHEGVSFLTKTLPAFGNAIFQAFQTGSFHGFKGFKHSRESGCLPVFLSGLTSRLFSPKTGEKVSDDPDIAWAIRQICLFLYKYEIPHTEKQEREAICKMLVTDASLPDTAAMVNELDRQGLRVLGLARQLLERLFFNTDLKEIIPRHGSGATEEGGIPQHEKYRFRNFSGMLGEYYPKAEYTCPSLNHLYAIGDQDSPGGNGSAAETARVCAVPKDSRKPRIISAEPKERMWIQQGQMKALVATIESHPLTRGHVNFADQTINGAQALKASSSGRFATLDMEAASDRVSLALAELALPAWIFKPLCASRSTHTQAQYNLGSSVQITVRQELRKFAPMGSAVCFPIESILFWALCVSAVVDSFDLEVKDVANQFYIFGDDIICPTDWAGIVMDTLEKFSLRFNREKSFTCGPFRESCGVDAYMGVDITPIRLKKRRPDSKRDASSLVGWLDSSNLLYGAGLWRASDLMKSQVERILGYIPILRPSEAEQFGGLCWHSFSANIDNKLSGWRKVYQRKEPSSFFRESTVTMDGDHGFIILRPMTFKPTKVRQGGKRGFLMLKPSYPKPYYGRVSYEAITYVLKNKPYMPSYDEFPEESAMLRWFTTASSNSEREFGASRTFAQRYNTSLRRRVMRLR